MAGINEKSFKKNRLKNICITAIKILFACWVLYIIYYMFYQVILWYIFPQYEEMSYRNNGEPYYTNRYEYDSDGNCVRTITDYADTDKADIEKYFAYSHDASGRVIRKATYNKDGAVELIETFKYYDDGGYAKIVQFYDENGSVADDKSYDVLYDPKDRIIYKKEYGNDQRKPVTSGTGIYYDEIEYFEIIDSDLQEWSMYNDTLINYKWYNHGSDGKLYTMVEVSYVPYQGSIRYACSITDYAYDSDGRLIEEKKSVLAERNDYFNVYGRYPDKNDTGLYLWFDNDYNLCKIDSYYFTDENNPGISYVSFSFAD